MKELQRIERILKGILESTVYSSFYIAVVVLDLLSLALQSSELIPHIHVVGRSRYVSLPGSCSPASSVLQRNGSFLSPVNKKNFKFQPIKLQWF